MTLAGPEGIGTGTMWLTLTFLSQWANTHKKRERMGVPARAGLSFDQLFRKRCVTRATQTLQVVVIPEANTCFWTLLRRDACQSCALPLAYARA